MSTSALRHKKAKTSPSFAIDRKRITEATYASQIAAAELRLLKLHKDLADAADRIASTIARRQSGPAHISNTEYASFRLAVELGELRANNGYFDSALSTATQDEPTTPFARAIASATRNISIDTDDLLWHVFLFTAENIKSTTAIETAITALVAATPKADDEKLVPYCKRLIEALNAEFVKIPEDIDDDDLEVSEPRNVVVTQPTAEKRPNFSFGAQRQSVF